MSTSLCGDSYLLDIAPEYASALSWQSRDSLSTANDEQRALPQVSDNLEVLLATNPTHVIFGAGEGTKTGPVLEARGVKTFTLDWADSVEAATINMYRVASIDESLSEKIEYHIGGLTDFAERKSSFNFRRPKVLYLSRSGATAGTNTFINDIISYSGGQNIVTQNGWFTPSTENLLAMNPDLIMTSFEGGFESAQAKAFRNKSIQNIIAKTPHVDVPAKYLVCAGPGMGPSVKILSAQVDVWDKAFRE